MCVVGLIFWADAEGLPVSSAVNCDRQQFVMFTDALQIVNGTHAGGQMGWLGML